MFINPIKYGYLTSKFGWRNVNKYDGKGLVKDWHQGVDLSFRPNTGVQVLASADGTVIRAQTLGTYGKVVMIKHIIKGVHYETNYAHLASYNVKVGQKVKQGEVIGIMGKTGGNWAPHLHFEIHKGPWVTGQKNAVNPAKYIEFYNETEMKTLKATIQKLEKQVNELTAKINEIEKDNNKLYNKEEAPSIWAKDSVIKAKSLGITDGTYLKRPATREEVIKMIVHAIK